MVCCCLSFRRTEWIDEMSVSCVSYGPSSGALRPPGTQDVMCGGMRRWATLQKSVNLSGWMLRTRCSSSTPAAPLVNPRWDTGVWNQLYSRDMNNNLLWNSATSLMCGTGRAPYCCRISALHVADLQACFWSSPWRCVLVHRRHRLDHRPLLHHLRPPCEWRHKCPGESKGVFAVIVGFVTLHRDACVCPFLQFEGIPVHPHVGRFWEIIEKYKVTTFYTAPTAIRLLMKYGREPLQE